MTYPGWLESYMRYAAFDRYPKHFHLACAMQTAGLAVAARVSGYYERWPIRTLPHFFLIGNSGVGKSSAIEMRKRVLDAAIPDLPAARTRFTSASFYRKIRENVPVLIEAEEFTTAVNKLDHLSDIIPMLTQLADNRHFDKSLKNEDYHINNTRAAMMFGTNEDGLIKFADKNIIEQGFAARFMWLYASKDDVMDTGKTPDEDQVEVVSAMKVVVDGLMQMKGIEGRISRAAAADTMLDAYRREVSAGDDSDRSLEGYRSRRLRFVLQWAAIAAICSGRLEVQMADVVWAINLLKEWEPQMMYVFQSLGMSESGRRELQLLTWLSKTAYRDGEGWVTVGRIKNAWHHRVNGSYHVQRMLDSLRDAGRVEREAVSGTYKYRRNGAATN